MAALRVLPPELIQRLGTVSDRVIARECGVATNVVWKWRKRYGISPFQPKTKTRKPREQDDVTMEQLDAMVAEQMRCLPAWWNEEPTT